MTGWILIVLISAPGVCASGTDDTPQFNRDIRPIFADKCFACHGPDAGTREADLRLDTREGALADLGGTRAIVPGNLRRSEVWKRITTKDEDVRMPPADSHKELSAEEVDRIRRWIEAGAPYEMHWAFEPIARPTLPGAGGQPSNPIDSFILEKLEQMGLSMSPEADKPTLIRRVAFTLTGLPPTLAEIEQFLQDTAPNAYEAMVDRYLASPHYGEEMARHWLDLARYGDTHGLHLDNERQMWAYRDWVIGAFNRNLPFDQFTIEQLAGDLLLEPTRDQLVATGFNRCNVTTSEGGAIDAEYAFRYAVDRTATMAETWLGLTAGCAVCHDHKYDPLTQKEFYSLYAFFNSAADPAMDGNALLTQPVLRLAEPEDEQQLAAWDARLAELRAQLAARVAAIDYVDPATLDPQPPPLETDFVWVDDAFPADGNVVASPGHPTQFVNVSTGEPVRHGDRALKRNSTGLAQDVWQTNQGSLDIPPGAKIYAHVWLDPGDVPQAIMLQFFKNGWLHRAVWGDYEVIDWGTPGTTERVSMGTLPEPGHWVRLEFDAETVGLHSGDRITGLALTQYGGTVYWDLVGVVGVVHPATDGNYSLSVWWQQRLDKSGGDIPNELKPLARAVPIDQLNESEHQHVVEYYLQHVNRDAQQVLSELQQEITHVENQRQAYDQAIPRTFIYRDVPQPRASFVMARGQYNAPGEEVFPNVPACLPPLEPRDSSKPADRLDLAQWLVNPNHPLTARVAVNRWWQQVFGTGLVRSSADFGTQGELPSHPELLDWLATHFRESGWDIRGLVRLMVTSRAFRQQSRASSQLIEQDPENRYYARGPRIRLDAEQIRDNALAVSGLIKLQMGGKGVKPYQPDNIWEPVGYVDSNTRFYKRDSGDALYRRSIYTFFKRTAPPPFMANFDAPNREQPCSRRQRSNTPLQALQLMNDVQHVEAARALAQRMMRSGGDDSAARIAWGFRLVTSRQPADDELDVLVRQWKIHYVRYSEQPEDAQRLIQFGESPLDQELDIAELSAYTLVASTIMNLDETLNRN